LINDYEADLFGGMLLAGTDIRLKAFEGKGAVLQLASMKE